MESVIFKYDLREAGLPDDIDGNEFESVLNDDDEKEWYVLEVLTPEQVPFFIKMLSKSWFKKGRVSRTNYDSSDDDLYTLAYNSSKYWKPSNKFLIDNPSYYSDFY